MKQLSKIFIFSFLCLIISCKSSKSTANKTMEEYKNQGYTLGIIEPNSESDCGWIISVEGEENKYDPINIESEEFAQFSLKKTSIFFKFLRLRIQNRCEDALPIRLIEVIKK